MALFDWILVAFLRSRAYGGRMDNFIGFNWIEKAVLDGCWICFSLRGYAASYNALD